MNNQAYRVNIKSTISFRIISILCCIWICGVASLWCQNIKHTKSNKKTSIQKVLVLAKNSGNSLPATNTKPKSAEKTLTQSANKEGDYSEISFDELGGFEYEEPYFDGKKFVKQSKSQIPLNVKSLTNKKVFIKGFYYPIDFDESKVDSFLLLRNPIQCCFADAVRMNEWIFVKPVDPKLIKSNLTAAVVKIYGKLEVGEEFKDGALMNIYRMNADKIVVETH